ncbi:MAG: enoyl-CoA hydratase/isomerase family protein [Cyclobacteriaceae bacterium]
MQFVKYKVAERRADLILCRPEKKNALHPDMVTELLECLHSAKEDASVKVIVLSSEGSVFSAGADLSYLKSLQSNTYEENLKDSQYLKSLFQHIYEFPKPIIAQVEGHAIAGGAGLMSVCDFIFCTPETKIGYSEVRIGFVPAIVSYFLIRKIGEARATAMLLSGSLFDVKKCLEFGLINKVVESSHIVSEVDDFAKKLIKANSAESMKLTKQLIKEVQSMGVDAALNKAAEFNAKARETQDCKNGIDAFLEKKKIEW